MPPGLRGLFRRPSVRSWRELLDAPGAGCEYMAHGIQFRPGRYRNVAMRTIAVVAVALSLAGAAPAAFGQGEGLRSFRVMKPGTALDLARAALDDCRSRGYQVAVAVVDRFGATQVVLRDELAGAHTPETARRKAWTAVSFRTDTLTLAEVTEAGGTASGIRYVSGAMMVGGGIPVEAAGEMVGGVGVSGAPGGDADAECATAGIEAVSDALEF